MDYFSDLFIIGILIIDLDQTSCYNGRGLTLMKIKQIRETRKLKTHGLEKLAKLISPKNGF